jgi:hypothetical protein
LGTDIKPFSGEREWHAEITRSRNAILNICGGIKLGRKVLGVFSVNGKIKGHKEGWLERVERMEGGRVPKQAVWYRPGRNKRSW